MTEAAAAKTAFSATAMWQVATIALVAALAVSVLTQGFSFTGFSAGSNVTANQVATKVITYVNGLLDGQATATLISVGESNGLYNVKFSIEDQSYDSYATKDGSLLFPTAYVLNTTTSSTTNTTGYPKSNKPDVELFVMAFCPYGVQAEQAMKPVVDTLGGYADFTVKFIVNVNGNATSDVQSLHGAPEAAEDLRQVCIRENYNQSTYWTYVSEIDDNCYSIYRNATQMDACWKAAASTAGINATLVENCVNATAVSLIKQDEATTDSYGVSSSPTIFINGQKYSGGRSADAIKSAVCSAFTTAPAACNQTLSTTAGTASGDCG